MDEDLLAVKKTARTRKTTKPVENEEVVSDTPVIRSNTAPLSLSDAFNSLLIQITQSKQEFENLQREIDQIRKIWTQEKQDYETDLLRIKQQEELERKREEETYQYNLILTRKRAEDEFSDKKLAWEKELSGRKEQLEKDRQELEALRKQAAEFDLRIEQAVRHAEENLKSSLTGEFETEKKLREQEVKSEKEILGLKIESLSSEVKRQAEEIVVLKKSLDQAQEQVKQIAVKVIEGGTPKTQPSQEN